MTRLLSLLLTILLALPAMAEPTDSVSTANVDTFTTCIRSRIDELLQNDMFKTSQVGVYVYDLTADSAIYKYNWQQRMRPASCEKIMTSASALASLGCDYTYKTRLYVATTKPHKTVINDTIVVDSTSCHINVYIEGGFDPMLGADDLKSFAHALREQGVSTIIDDIICDVSFKDTLNLGWGWCWDDDEGPLTPLLYQGKDTFRSHFISVLKTEEIEFSGKVVRGRVPKNAKLIDTRTHTIDQILIPMMKKSDNMYAESMFYQMAAKSGKDYPSYKDGANMVKKFITKCGDNPKNYEIADGSGLSLYNYLSPELLVDVLRYIYHHEDIYNHFFPALPIMGKDGTLRKRCKDTSAEGKVHAKTGTVTGVSTLSGYATADNGHELAFSIMNQGIRQASIGRGFQDKVCKALTQSTSIKTLEPSEDEPDEAEPEEDEPDKESPEVAQPENNETPVKVTASAEGTVDDPFAEK